jgi:aldose 1-epimerase
MLRGIIMVLVLAKIAGGGEVTRETDPGTNWDIFVLKQGENEVRLAPDAGCNAYSWKYQGTELFRVPEKLADLPGYAYGNPVIYPMPNRVRDAVLTFQGQTLKYPANNGANFLHGLVHSVPWQVIEGDADTESASLTCQYDFAPGTQALELFPFPHKIRLSVRVAADTVRWTYTVDNGEGQGPVPFGMCLHPYFIYQGSRANSFLTVPATNLMESVNLLPTGKLLPLDGTKFDARKPISLEGFVIDDVYFGMTPEKPAEIDFRDKKIKVALRAAKEFNHMVVYTPEQPFLCVENQSCSTDAHNLYNQDRNDAAHLIVLEPGETHTGWIEYQVSKNE